MSFIGRYNTVATTPNWIGSRLTVSFASRRKEILIAQKGGSSHPTVIWTKLAQNNPIPRGKLKRKVQNVPNYSVWNSNEFWIEPPKRRARAQRTCFPAERRRMNKTEPDQSTWGRCHIRHMVLLSLSTTIVTHERKGGRNSFIEGGTVKDNFFIVLSFVVCW